MGSGDKEEILAAIAGISERLAAMDQRLLAVEDVCTKTARAAERIEQRVNAIARKTLTATECMAIGVPDPRVPPTNVIPLPAVAKE